MSFICSAAYIEFQIRHLWRLGCCLCSPLGSLLGSETELACSLLFYGRLEYKFHNLEFDL